MFVHLFHLKWAFFSLDEPYEHNAVLQQLRIIMKRLELLLLTLSNKRETKPYLLILSRKVFCASLSR